MGQIFLKLLLYHVDNSKVLFDLNITPKPGNISKVDKPTLTTWAKIIYLFGEVPPGFHPKNPG